MHRGLEVCPVLHRWSVMGSGFEPKQFAAGVGVLNQLPIRSHKLNLDILEVTFLGANLLEVILLRKKLKIKNINLFSYYLK